MKTVNLGLKDRLYGFYRRHRFGASMASVAFLFVFGCCGLVVAGGETLEPNDSHVVLLYVDGQELNVPSRAKTVGEFLGNVGVEVGEFDNIEPATDSIINVDLFRVRVSRARPYVVNDGNKKYAALSAHTSARLIAEAAGLDLKPADEAEFMPIDITNSTQIGRTIEVKRAKRILLSVYGSTQEVYTNASNFGELLDELAISPAPDDETSLARSDKLTDGAQVFISRRGIKVAVVEEPINQPVEYIQDPDLTIGSSVIRDPGRPGKKVVTYEIITQNDVELTRREISSIIIEQPITKIVARGRAAGQIGDERRALMAQAGIPESEFAAVDYIINNESGWCATKWQGQWGRCPDFYEELHSTSAGIGYGLCQSTPAIKMASYGEDWATNPVTQLKWCYNYMLAYGSAVAAADFKQCLGECYSPRTNSVVYKQTTWF